jgi:outer membrane immunogenic protein
LKYVLLTGVAATALMAAAGSVFAADLMPLKAAPPVVAYDWSGVYVGGVLGGAWGRTDSSDPGLGVIGTLVSVPVTQTTDSSGFIGGVEGGMRYQLGKLVVGTEADITWGNVNGTSTTSFGPPGAPGLLTRSITADSNWIGTATNSIGIAHDRWLIYSKAGVAWAHTNYTDNWVANVGGSIPLFTGAGSENRVGWTVGAGIEWAVWNNWSVKAEYDYLDFGNQTVAINGTLPSRHRQFSGVVRHGERATHQPIQGRFELAPSNFLVRINFAQSSRVGRGRRRGG